MSSDLYRRLLSEAGAVGQEIDELLVYNKNHFRRTPAEQPENQEAVPTFPLPDEPFVECWRAWVSESETAVDQGSTAFEVLCRHLPQLRFPIRQGISQSADYRLATLQGVDPDTLPTATGLPLEQPQRLRFDIYPSLAGGIPVIETHRRGQFETMVRALSKRNEPEPIPQAMGAQMIAGFNNWSRIHALRQAWQASPDGARQEATWAEAFAVIRQRKELYQDRLVLLSDGPYSAVPATALGLSEDSWRTKSLLIRREHECTHYFTRRVFGSMHNHLLDELIADYAGIVAAEGHFRADWFLHFMGLEDRQCWRPDGRLAIYRGEPALSNGAFRVLQKLTVRAAENLERFDQGIPTGRHGAQDSGRRIIALARRTILDLASDQGIERLHRSL